MKSDLPIFYPSHHFMDKAAKWLLGEGEQMKELLSVIAPHLLPLLNFEIYEKMDHSHISEEFHERESDALFRVGLKKGKNGELEVFIYILFEHQSRPDRWIRYRFLQSQSAIWRYFYDRAETAKRKGQKGEIFLPPIIPLLFYTGKENWRIPSLGEALKFPVAMGSLSPVIPLLSIGLYMESGEKLLSSATGLGESCRLLTLVELEKERFKEELREIHLRVMEIYRENRGLYRRFLRFVVSLIYHKRGADERDEMVEFVKSQTKPADTLEVTNMKKTMADVLFEEGMEKGIEKGLEKGRAEGIKKTWKAVLRILCKRFGEVSEEIEKEIKEVRNLDKLDELLELALDAASLVDFEEGMGGIKN